SHSGVPGAGPSGIAGARFAIATRDRPARSARAFTILRLWLTAADAAAALRAAAADLVHACDGNVVRDRHRERRREGRVGRDLREAHPELDGAGRPAVRLERGLEHLRARPIRAADAARRRHAAAEGVRLIQGARVL